MGTRVVLLGGTGFVGRALVNCAAARAPGLHWVVPTRNETHGAALRLLPQVEVVRADVLSPSALEQVLRGADAAVNLIGVLHGNRKRFERIHAELPRALVAACRAAGVGRLVHMGALGASPGAPSKYLASKAAGEQAVRDSNLAWTVLRPSVIFGAEDRFLNLFAAMQLWTPIVPLACARAKFQPVWVNDVAQALIRCLQRPDTVGRIYELAGPQVFTLAELVRLAGRRSGHRRPVLPLPAPLAYLQALALEWLPGGPLLSRDNLRSMRVPNVATSGSLGLRDLGIEPTSVEAADLVEHADRERAAARNRWRAAAARG